jgi:hypothetical protein
MPAQRLRRCRWRSEQRERLEAWAASDSAIITKRLLFNSAGCSI